MQEIYLDYAATTKPLKEVADCVTTVMLETYGNPSSLHKLGIEAETIIKKSTRYFANILGCKEDEIYYTSGATESNNLALIGAAYAYQRMGRKIITTTIEHPSVTDVFTHLEKEGFEVVRIGVDHNGLIIMDELKEAIDDQTIIVSAMYVNNEIGTIQNITEIGNWLKKYAPRVIFHVDGVQAFGKMPINVGVSKIDLLSISAHKFYGPKGIGILYKRKEVRMLPLFHGGGQQKAIRSGTENVPGIAGMHCAAMYCYDNLAKLQQQCMESKRYLSERILNEIEGTKLNGPSIDEGAAHILNIQFQGVRAEVLLHTLEHYGIYVSSGSACASNKIATSNTLVSIGQGGEQLDQAIRFSFGRECDKNQLDYVVDVLKKQLPLLKRFTTGGKKR
ncbi:MAG: cysteine desulfurase family protein [Cellulosilyticaceae bacterium]